MNKIIGIYKITSPSKKVYIGQSVDIKSRLSKYKNLNCKTQPKLYNSLVKHGCDRHIFEIIDICDVCDLNEKERYYQELYNCIESGLNCVFQRTDYKKQLMSSETKLKISNTTKGKQFSEETKLKLSFASKGKPKSDEHKVKISISKKGMPRYKHSIETLAKLSENNKNSILILDLNTGVFYNSASELCLITGHKFSALNAKLSGQNKNDTQYVRV